MTDREALADLILSRLLPVQEQLAADFRQPSRIPSCFIDDLLPTEMAREIFDTFPAPAAMMEKKSLREHKLVSAQMNLHDPLLEEIVFAFQDPRIVQLAERLTGIKGMLADSHLYAGGISLMAHGHFLNPHLDNSHDKDRDLYRVLNLLYYVTPDWNHESGGNLELWDEGPEGKPREIESRFNRLVLMATHENSWHSVTPVVSTGAARCCISNYYFAPAPLEDHGYFHVTTFRGRPEQPFRNLVLRCDSTLRMAIRSVFPKGVKKTRHLYERDGKTNQS
jgi:Rps23 Pro-64 3,4-dihydroxylase Tpa1-like proline 4-hydroxylase